MNRKAVTYYRVSTASQGASGLGLAAQASAVAAFCGSSGYVVTAEFTEIESGKRDDRPQLAAAIAKARKAKAVLVIARLDRLARNVAFIANLMDAGVEFEAVDMPFANRLTIHILAAVAEAEGAAISARTKAALAAARARGTVLGAAGRANLTAAGGALGRERGRATIGAKRVAAYADLRPELVEMRAAGHSLREIASVLNERGETTRQDRQWSATQVARAIA